MPDLYPTDRASLERDSDMEFFIATGPGGQNRNKVQTGVRLVHRPTGTTVTATERRSQHANREAAFERLAARLEELQRVVPPRVPTRPTAASKVRRLDAKRRSIADLEEYRGLVLEGVRARKKLSAILRSAARTRSATASRLSSPGQKHSTAPKPRSAAR